MSVSEWSGDSGTRVPGADVDATASAAGDPEASATASGNGGSGDLSGSSVWAAVEALAALLEPEAFDPAVTASPEWREPTQAVALNHAAKVITSGYRLVSEDEATVRRVENVLADWVDGNGPQAFWTAEDAARAAVRALREGQ